MDIPEKKSRRVRGTTPEIEAAARELRRNMTPAERTLWSALRGRRLNGLKLRCQHPVGPFILDFYCAAHKLAIELDGEIHDSQVEYDAARTQRFREHGYQVIRFRNEEVLMDLGSVLEYILSAVLVSPPTPQAWGVGGLIGVAHGRTRGVRGDQ